MHEFIDYFWVRRLWSTICRYESNYINLIFDGNKKSSTNFSRDEMSVTFSTFLSEKLRDEGSFRQKKKCQSKVCKILRKWWIMSNVSYFSLLSMLHTAVTHIPLYEFLTQIKSTRDSRNFKGMIDAAAATTSSPSYFKTWNIISTKFKRIFELEL